jgi:hypothetical protein
MQKSAVRLVCGKKSGAHTSPLFKKIGVLPLHDLFLYFKAQFMFYYINNKTPTIFQDTWQQRNRDARLRRNQEEDGNLVPFYRLTTVERLPYVTIPMAWRNTPVEVRSSSNILEFNAKMKDYLISNINLNIECNRVLCPDCNRL